jgi:hypothetical protein
MKFLLVLALAGSSWAWGAEPIRVACPGMTGANVTPELIGFYTEHLGQRLAQQGLRVTTAKQVQAMIGFEKQRQLLGCTDDSSCLTEIVGALNADAIVLGDVARLGPSQQINLRVIDSKSERVLATFSARLQGEGLVLETLERAAVHLAASLSAKLKRPLLKPSGTQEIAELHPGAAHLESGTRRFAWLPALVGVAAAGAGGAFYLQARSSYDQLAASSGGPIEGRTADELRDAGRRQQTLAIGGFGTAAAALAIAGVLFALGGSSSQIEAGVALTPSGGGVTLVGALP